MSLYNRYSKFFKGLACLGLILFSLLNVADTKASENMESLFNERKWQAMDSLFPSISKSLSSRDLYLYANSLWLRGRWKDALDLFLSSAEIPESLLPYRKMLVILGYERTGQEKQALELASGFFQTAPEDLKYYVAYAMARLGGDKLLWYSKMLDLASNGDQRKTALEGLVSLPDAELSHALELIKIEPQNSKALNMLLHSGEDYSDMEIPFYTGYSLYLKGRFEQARAYFDKIPSDNSDFGLRAGYYRAFCCYRLGDYDKALDLWKGIAMDGREYSSSSARRIAIMAGKLPVGKVLESLEKISESLKGDARLTALYYMSTLYDGEKRKYFEGLILRDFPSSTYAIRSLWDRGWGQWKENNYDEALSFWNGALKQEIDGEWRSRLLYWKGKAQEQLGDSEFGDTLGRLADDYPLSIYTFRAFPNGAWKISDRLPDGLKIKHSLLESWGFMPYALMQAQRGQSPEDYFRAACLASWLGDGHSSLLSAAKIYGILTSGKFLSAEGLRLLYPRPYRETVEKTAARFSVEPALIWSIMRQESAFDPNATSYVGACGLMQLMPGTAGDEASKLGLKDYDVYDISTNVLLGVSHIARLLKKFRRLDWSIAAYNAGAGSLSRWTGGVEETPPDEWIEDIPYLETYGYVKKVLSNLYVYRLLYEGSGDSKSGS